MSKTTLIGMRKPTNTERRDGVDVVFKREDSEGRVHTIYACKCYDSWEQWGASNSVLSDNVKDVEIWRRSNTIRVCVNAE